MSSTRVYVGGLPRDVRQRDVEQFFQGYGRITEIALKDGYGFAEFADRRDADDAVYELDGRRLWGRRLTVQNAQKPRGRSQYRNHNTMSKVRFSPARRTKFQVIVENLSSQIQWQDLKDFFTKVGKVTYAKAHNKQHNQGMAEFATYEDMQKVMEELDGADLKGRNIRIIEARRSKSRSPTHSNVSPKFRSKSRSPAERKSKSPSRSREEVTTKAEVVNANSEADFESLEESRKRSHEDSEDDSRTVKRSEKSGSESRSPSN